MLVKTAISFDLVQDQRKFAMDDPVEESRNRYPVPMIGDTSTKKISKMAEKGR